MLKKPLKERERTTTHTCVSTNICTNTNTTNTWWPPKEEQKTKEEREQIGNEQQDGGLNRAKSLTTLKGNGPDPLNQKAVNPVCCCKDMHGKKHEHADRPSHFALVCLSLLYLLAHHPHTQVSKRGLEPGGWERKSWAKRGLGSRERRRRQNSFGRHVSGRMRAVFMLMSLSHRGLRSEHLFISGVLESWNSLSHWDEKWGVGS